MSTSRKRRLELSDRACLQCQRRKTRCIPSDDGGACVYCQKMGKSCAFGDPPSRTPLTRKNLDEVESRCQRLEALIKNLRPNTNVDDILDDESFANAQQSELDSTVRVPPESSSIEAPAVATHSYEWQEALGPRSGQNSPSRRTRQDGMASLGAPESQAGYLGDTAGSSLLGSVSSMLLEHSQKQYENRHATTNGQSEGLTSSNFSSITSRLNTSVWHAHLIDLYFASYNVSYPVIHERSFREQQNARWRLSSTSPWHIIYYMVLAIGEWVGGYSSDDQSVFYEAARSRLNIEFILETGNLGVVEAFLLLGNYLQKRDRPNTGYNYIGIAYRVALGLGLHREIASAGTAPTFQLQRRRLLFWTLYCFESGFSITTGRPTLVSDSFIDARKPQNIDDSQCTAESQLPAEADHPTGCTAIAAQARLAVIANRIHTNFLSARNCGNVDHEIAILEQAIQNWREALPSSFEDDNVPKWFLGPRQVILWKETNLRILLLLAGQRHQTDEEDKAALGARCQNVAIRAINEVTQFCYTYPELIHQGLSWYAVYFLLQAALALGVYQIKEKRKSSRRQTVRQNSTGVEKWDSALVAAYQCLELLGEKNTAAVRTLKLLDRLRQNTILNGGGTNSECSVSPNNTTTFQTNPLGVASGAFGSQQQQASATSFPGTSPADAIATNFVNNEWVAAADPSLHLFLDYTHSMDGMFEDVQGFPSTMEQDNFAYMTSSMRTVRFDPFHNHWPEASDAFNEPNGDHG